MTANLAPNYDPDLAFKGGWVTVGLIRRPVLKVRPVDEPEVVDPDIVCTYCGARFWESCRSPNGSSSRAHKIRTRPRTCRCGGEVESTNATCSDCQRINAAARDITDSKIRRNLELKCQKGHAQAKDDAGNWRACKTCQRERDVARRRKQREAQRAA